MPYRVPSESPCPGLLTLRKTQAPDSANSLSIACLSVRPKWVKVSLHYMLLMQEGECNPRSSNYIILIRTSPCKKKELFEGSVVKTQISIKLDEHDPARDS